MRSIFVVASILVVSLGDDAYGAGAHFWCPRNEDGLCETSGEDNFSQDEMRNFVNQMVDGRRFAASLADGSSSQAVDASTIQNKVLAGYQGWDAARSTWDHWSKDGKAPGPKNAHFEMVPQMGEYPKGALQDTTFKYNGNGSTVPLYVNAAEGVVDLHFKWMKDYGLDGVLVQRFISECTKPGKALTQRNTIMQQSDAAATKHGRVYAMMWDMSGASAKWDTDIKSDWKNYVKKYVSSKQYLKENGKPVVCIFGIGLHDRAQATPSSSLSLIRWLQAEGLYVIGSGPYYWRTGGHDSASGFDKVHAAFDAIMPWAVGRYNTVKDFQNKVPQIKGDAAFTSSRQQGYAPIAYAGYSYRDSGKINFIKRNAGQFFKAQIDTFLATQGTTFYYIAMFDEVQEGTAIYKFAANEAESAKGATFVTASIDGVDCPGDLYLTMAGQYAAAAKGGPSPAPIPTPPSPAPSPTPPSPQADTMALGQTLSAGQHLHSASGNAHLEMQGSDGNLVLYGNNKVLWASNTSGHPGAHLDFQSSDGNLVLHDLQGTALWSSGAQHGAAKLVLQDDCNLVILSSAGTYPSWQEWNGKSAGTALWSLGTSCKSQIVV